MKIDILFTILGAICFLVAGLSSASITNKIAIILVGIANILFMLR